MEGGDTEEEESPAVGPGMVEVECYHVVALQKINDLTEWYQDDLHGALERQPHRPKTCSRE